MYFDVFVDFVDVVVWWVEFDYLWVDVCDEVVV